MLSPRLNLSIAFLALWLACTHSLACKLAPEAVNLERFLASKRENKIVFQGKVESVEDVGTSNDGVRTTRIHFLSSHWWRGKARVQVIAVGNVGVLRGSSCEGVFDFQAHPGEEWFVVGADEKGIVRPSGALSMRITTGTLPDKVLRILKSKNKDAPDK